MCAQSFAFLYRSFYQRLVDDNRCNYANDPRQGVRQIEVEQALVGGEIECSPGKAKSTEADDIEYCGNAGNTVSAQRCGNGAIESVNEGKRGNGSTAGCSVGNRCGCIGQEQANDLMAENEAKYTKNNTAHNGDEHAAAENLLNSVMLLCAYVLSGKYGAALTKAVHSSEDKAVDIDSCSVTGNGKRTNAVYRSLQRYIGACQAGGLEAGRNADFEYSCHLILLHSQLFQLDTTGLVKAQKMLHLLNFNA